MVFILKFTYFCPQCDVFRECTDRICKFFFSRYCGLNGQLGQTSRFSWGESMLQFNLPQ